MNCKKCGAMLQDDDIFCQNCGSKIEKEEIQGKNTEEIKEKSEPKPAAAETPAKNTSEPKSVSAAPEFENAAPMAEAAIITDKKSNVVLIGIVAAVIILIGIAAAILLLPKGSSMMQKGIICIGNYQDETTYIIDNGKVISKLPERSYVNNAEYSSDMRCGVIRTFDDNLYFFDKTGTKKIASEAYNWTISDNGSSVLYEKDETLFLYKVSSDKSERIAENTNNFTISSDGNSILYTLKDDNEIKGNIWNNGKISELDGKGISPIAIANNAKYVYYAKENDDYTCSLYVYTGKDSTKLSSNFYPNTVSLNQDCSEIMYCTEKGTYISVEGTDSQKISSDFLTYPVYPYTVRYIYSNIWDLYINKFEIDTFQNKALFSSENDIRYLTCTKKEWSSEKVAADVSNAYVSADFKSLVYLKNQKLYYIKDLRNGNSDSIELADDILSFIPSQDLSYCYAADVDNSLYFIDKKVQKKIADDVCTQGDFTYGINTEGKIFFTSDDVLYSAYKQDAKEKINGNDCAVISFNNNILYGEQDDDICTLYANTNGNKFECVIKDFDW